MNFMNNSIFQRNKACEREEESPEEGGVLAVWGSPSTGKTVVSVKLAEHLARKKRNVILILADMITPPLPYLCVPSDMEQERSLGSILAAAHVTENLVKKNCMFYRKSDHLSIIGMLKGENVFTYPPYEKEQAEENGTAFTGMTFVITGSVEHFANRKELQALIESKGGKATGSVTSKTTYLINNDTQSSSSKNKKAKELGIPILSEEDFLKLLQEKEKGEG